MVMVKFSAILCQGIINPHCALRKVALMLNQSCEITTGPTIAMLLTYVGMEPNIVTVVDSLLDLQILRNTQQGFIDNHS